MGANMGPTWGRQVPGEAHVGPMNGAIWVGVISFKKTVEELNSQKYFITNSHKSFETLISTKLVRFKYDNCQTVAPFGD